MLLRRRPLLRDLPEQFPPQAEGHGTDWVRYWRGNPVKAWIGENSDGGALFALRDGHFESNTQVAATHIDSWTGLIQEVIDYRLAAYEARQTAVPATNVVPFVKPTRLGTELPFFPNIKIACGHFKTGRADAEEYRVLGNGHGRLDPQRHFIARASGNSMNGGKNPIRDGDYLLLERISSTSAGSITGSVMAIERQDESGDNQYLLRVVIKDPKGGYILRANNPDYRDMDASDEMRTLARLKEVIDPLELAVGQAIAREDIPGLFGTEFNPGNWNVGHVVLPDQKAHVLLITINKQGKAKEHRFADYWIDERTFHWQSQNATTPQSSKGKGIIGHARLGWSIHLFVREHKLSNGKGAPFVYHGRAHYVSHEGSAPMNVTLRLDD